MSYETPDSPGMLREGSFIVVKGFCAHINIDEMKMSRRDSSQGPEYAGVFLYNTVIYSPCFYFAKMELADWTESKLG